MKQQTLKLNEICEIITSPVDKKSYKEETPVLLCNYTDVYYNEFITKDINFMKATASDNEIKRYSLYKGDVVITKDSETPNDIGISTYIAEDIENLVCGYHLAILRPNTKYVNGLYLAYYLKLQQVLHIFGRFANGITRYSLINATYKAVPVLLPPLEEQKKIAEILSLWDKAIEQTKDLIVYKEKQKKGLMQALLTGKKRLNGFTDEWKTYTINELGEVKTGKTPSTTKAEYYNGDIMFITPTDIKNKFTSNTDRYLTNAGLKKSIFIPKNSILITCIASIGKNTINSESCACNQQINVIIPNYSNYYEYLYYHISYNTPYIEKFAGNSATAIINKSTFEEIDITIPPLDEQKAIADILSSADEEIELLNKQLELYTEQKKGLMQNLLTGKVRV